MKRAATALLALLLAACFRPADRAVRVSAPTAPPAVDRVELPLPADEAPPIARQYRLTFGDTLLIEDLSVPQTRRERVLVAPDGTISYLHISDVPAAGRTLDEVQTALGERLRALHRDPHPVVHLAPEAGRGHQVYVFGQVNAPGAIAYLRPMRVLEALAEAGGFKIEVRGNIAQQSIDLHHTLLLRGGQAVGVDFARLVERGDLRHNITLHPGDLILVASLLDQDVYVLGAVGRPGVLPLTSGMGMVGALARAGGVREQAWRSTVVLLRGSLARPDVFVLDMDEVLSGRVADLPVRKGDVIFVPERPLQYPRELLQVAIRAFVGQFGVRVGDSTIDSIGVPARR